MSLLTIGNPLYLYHVTITMPMTLTGKVMLVCRRRRRILRRRQQVLPPLPQDQHAGPEAYRGYNPHPTPPPTL